MRLSGKDVASQDSRLPITRELFICSRLAITAGSGNLSVTRTEFVNPEDSSSR